MGLEAPPTVHTVSGGYSRRRLLERPATPLTPRDGHTAHSRPESAIMDCAPSRPAATGKFPGTLQDRDRDRRTPTTCHSRHAIVTIPPTIPAANHTNLRSGRAGVRVHRVRVRSSCRRAPRRTCRPPPAAPWPPRAASGGRGGGDRWTTAALMTCWARTIHYAVKRAILRIVHPA